MAAARFFIDAPLAPDLRTELPASVAHHATRVLRLRDGASIVLFNGNGGEFAATLSIDGRKARALIGRHDPIERESPLAVTLIQSWIANDKLNWTVEKAVELGVASIVLAPAQRSVIKLVGDRLTRRVQRLSEIAEAACSQCGRNRIPQIDAASSLSAALEQGLRDEAQGLLLLPDAGASLNAGRLKTQRAALAVGPEGGFDDSEVALALQLGYRALGLGPRVLRTETAGLAALAVLQASAGDFA